MRRGSEARGTTSKVSRGTDANIAYVFTRSPKLADPVPSPRAAPELARYDRRPPHPCPQRYTDLLTSTLPPGYCTEDLAAGHRTFADRLADRQSQRIPSEDPDYGDLGPAFPAWPGPGQDAILQ